MRIVHAVRSDSFSGVERYITYVAVEQARRGHEVVVIGGDPDFMGRELETNGVVHRPAASTFDVIRRLLARRRFQPHIVHSHMTAADTASLLVLPVVSGACVSTLHFAKPRGRNPILQRLWSVASLGFSEQIAISGFVANEAGTNATVVWNGVPDLEDLPGSKPAERDPVVLVAQRFEAEKDTATALNAWAVSDLRHQGWELHLAGRGRERPDCELLAQRLGITSSVRFLGMVDDLAERMGRASIFLATAPAEPFGLSVVEAMRAGVPVVAADGGAHRELLRPSETDDFGALFAPGDVVGAASALDALGENRARRDAMGNRNRMRYEERFTVQAHVDQLDERYSLALRTDAKPAARHDWPDAIARVLRKRAVPTVDLGRPIRVAFVDHCARLSGGELALVRLLAGFEGVEAHVILGEHGPLEDRLRAADTSFEVLPLDPDMANTHRDEVRSGVLGVHRVLATVSAVWKLQRRLRQLRPDVVHTNSLKAAIYGGVAGRLAGVPVVWHVRDRIADDYLPGPVARAVRLLARLVPRAIICNSAATRRTLGLADGVEVIPSPVVYDSVDSAGHCAGSADGSFRVAIVGRLAPWKGQDVFLEAFALAFPDGAEDALIVGSAMFGEDLWEDRLRSLVSELGLDGRVTFTGFIDDVPARLEACDVLVHASVIPEPFGQVVVEGMAMGLPVIAAAAGGPLEVVTDGVDGLLTPPGDVPALAEQLRRLRDEPELRLRLGLAGRERSADFAPDRVAAMVTAVYDRLL